MPTYDFDFQRYVARKKGARDAERREGQSYAYAGDLRIRKLLARARPVELALEATVRLWRATARAELLGTARRATELDYPRVLKLAHKAAERLHVQPPAVFVSPHLDVSCATFGTDDEPQLLLHAGLADSLSDAELLHALGAECGRVQNTQVLLGTALHYLRGREGGFVRWIVRPAVASLAMWARRGVVTADRAGLLASRDLEASKRAITALAAFAEDVAAPPPSNDSEAAPESGEPDGDGAADVRRRLAALEVFSRSAYYRGVLGETGGLLPADCDAETARALKGAA